MTTSTQIETDWKIRYKKRLFNFLRYLRRNPSLGVGLGFLLSLFLFVVIGYAVYDTERFRPLKTGTDLAPFEYDSKKGRNGYPLGTDR